MASELASKASHLQSFTLGDWLVDPRACHVSRGETVVKLRPQLVDVLVCLARRAGQIVLKDEILADVWPGQYIADSGLSRCIAELRQVLQDDVQAPRYIETIPKRGYRLVAPVAWLPTPGAAFPPEGGASAANGLPAVPGPTAALVESGEPPAAAAEPEDSDASARVAAASETPDAQVGGPRLPVFDQRRLWAVIALLLLAAAIIAMLVLVRRPASVLTERDPVLLAFENRTGDAVFDEVIPLAMSIQLEQSPYLALLSPGRVREVLQMMKRPPDTAMTRAVGLEVCERAGARAVIVTSIASLGRQYAIGLEAVACGTGDVLARRQVTAERKEAVLAGLERAAGEIRAAVGEPAGSLARYNVPIVEATTRSLDALRALRRGDLARERGDLRAALGFYREAVSLDGEFALARSRLGSALYVLGTEAESLDALQKAYSLRDRVTFPERLEIEAEYHRRITGAQDEVIAALERLARTYPRRAPYRRSLSYECWRSGQHDLALSEALEARRLEPTSALALAAAGFAYLALARVAEARAVAEEGVAAGGVSPLLHLVLFQCGLATGDAQLLARERAWAAANGEFAAIYFLECEAEEALNRGRLRDALTFLERFETLMRTTGSPDMAAHLRLRMARFEALTGKREDALRRLREEIGRGVPPLWAVDAVMVAATAGDFDLAERLLDEIDARGSGIVQQPQATLVAAYRAAVDAHRGRIDQALARLVPLEKYDLGFGYSLNPLYERARLHYLAGDWARARAAFEKILAHHTIDSGRKLLPSAELNLARTLARAGDLGLQPAGLRAVLRAVA